MEEGSMEEEAFKKKHRGGSMEEEAWRRKQGGGSMEEEQEEEAWRIHPEASGRLGGQRGDHGSSRSSWSRNVSKPYCFTTKSSRPTISSRQNESKYQKVL